MVAIIWITVRHSALRMSSIILDLENSKIDAYLIGALANFFCPLNDLDV